MTIQAYAWAIDQPLPGKAKLVLLALANHADHTTGQVHFDADMIAREASIALRSLWRYLGALERNGYLAHDDRKGKSDADARDYWLALDHDPTLAWSWSPQDGVQAEEGDDVDEPDRPPEVSTRLSASAPSTFRRDKQAAQRKVLTAPDPAIPVGQAPVIEGSKAFHAWCGDFRRRGRVPPFVQTIMVDGQERRGFWRPTLFPTPERIEAVEAFE